MSLLLNETQKAKLDSAVTRYESHLDRALPYLVARGITEETARLYRLGVVGDPVGRGDSEYVGRLAIPYITTTGTVVDVRYRALTAGDEPKYKSRPGSTARLYSVGSLVKSGDTIVLCEGEIDTVTMNQLGIPAVGFPGANAWKEHWRLLFADYDNVIVVCDGDQAGRDFGKKLAERIDNVQVVHLPDGSDVNDIYTSQGEAALRTWMGL